MVLKPARGTWQYGAEAYTPEGRHPGGPVERPERPRRLEPDAAPVPRRAHRNPVGHRRFLIKTVWRSVAF
jgi:hypothetical protein